ncbi:hypothetical protein OAA23_00630 [bacterium]|nr:hypothetical protein [bacterium]
MARRTSQSPLILTFFGLTPEYRQNLFSQIHEIVFHGQGGYDWDTIYNMPIWLRNFTFKKLEEFYEKQNEAQSKQSNTLKNTPGQIHRPNINPANVYNTSMPTKK